MIKVCCIRADSRGKIYIGSHYLVDTLDDVDAYVYFALGDNRYIGMFPSAWFIPVLGDIDD